MSTESKAGEPNKNSKSERGFKKRSSTPSKKGTKAKFSKGDKPKRDKPVDTSVTPKKSGKNKNPEKGEFSGKEVVIHGETWVLKFWTCKPSCTCVKRIHCAYFPLNC